mmetsp:Transcript_26022/g.75892  ORF Transcript_26022/g.75892 Transcript_26022/m.75892 type:complete len:260 (+) Transcript_26022:625-1404(+)
MTFGTKSRTPGMHLSRNRCNVEAQKTTVRSVERGSCTSSLRSSARAHSAVASAFAATRIITLANAPRSCTARPATLRCNSNPTTPRGSFFGFATRSARMNLGCSATAASAGSTRSVLSQTPCASKTPTSSTPLSARFAWTAKTRPAWSRLGDHEENRTEPEMDNTSWPRWRTCLHRSGLPSRRRHRLAPWLRRGCPRMQQRRRRRFLEPTNRPCCRRGPTSLAPSAGQVQEARNLERFRQLPLPGRISPSFSRISSRQI